MLLLFSTTLFVRENAVVYDVYMDSDNCKYFFKPVNSVEKTIYPPTFSVSMIQGRWQMDGTNEHDLKDQVIDDIMHHLEVSSAATSTGIELQS